MEKKTNRISEKKLAKRQQILDAASLIFIRDGYHKARVDEIAAVAGVGKGTVYEYFESKAALFQDMLEAKYAKNYTRIVLQLEQDSVSLREGMYRMVKNYIVVCEENRDLTFLVMKEVPFMGEDMKQWFMERQQEREAAFRSCIKQAIQDNVMREIDVEALLILCEGLLTTLHLSIAVGKFRRKDVNQLARAITDILMNGVAPEEKEPAGS